MTLEAELTKHLKNQIGNTDHQPLLFDPNSENDRSLLLELLDTEGGISILDTFNQQLDELIRSREPSLELTPKQMQSRINDYCARRPMIECGSWVFYPWSRSLVHILAECDFHELRSDRNRYKITTKEQKRLKQSKIGFIGLSVGQTIALTMALEGIGGEFRLTDMDSLGLSNLNRLRSPLYNIGLNKTVLAARHIYEINPYANIKVFPSGLDDSSFEEFLKDGGPLDLLIEECDDLYVKVRIREKARAIEIPVLMDTCDRGLIDIERFDLEPNRPIFHGLVDSLDAESLRNLSTDDKIPYIMRISGENTLSDRAIASILEIGQTINSLPQLASGVTLGAGLSTDIARRILLGDFNSSGRYFVDVEEIVSDEANASPLPSDSYQLSFSEESLATPNPTLYSSTGKEISREEISMIVSHGILAPSGHNGQPWRFVFKNGKLICLHELERSSGFLDYMNFGSYLGFGAVAENLSLAGCAIGYDANFEIFPDTSDPRLIFEIEFTKSRNNIGRPELVEQIGQRVTNRKLGQRHPLTQQDRDSIQSAVESTGAVLQILEDREGIGELGRILGAGDRYAFLSNKLHDEMFGCLRWNPEEVESTRDGLDVATLELTQSELIGMRLLSRKGTTRFVNALGGGSVLEKRATKTMNSASAIGLILAPGSDRKSFLLAGRAMQRAWLTATKRKLSIHPYTLLPFIFARLGPGQGEGMDTKEKALIGSLKERFYNCFSISEGWRDAFVFKIARAQPPSARALRRRIEDLLTFA